VTKILNILFEMIFPAMLLEILKIIMFMI